MSLETVPIREIMRRASRRHVLVPAFNVAHLPMLEAINEALAELNTFGLVEVALPDVRSFGAQSFAAVAQEYRRVADRRLSRLHLDHVPVIDEEGRRLDWRAMIEEGLHLGFDSVMIDGSRCRLQENIEATRAVVDAAQPRGVAVEAELGAVLGHEKGPLPPYEELFASGRGFTDVAEARAFVEATGTDWLSVAVGNIHGAISGAAKDRAKVQARLNIEHLRRLHDVTGVPLVLHGGSGIEPECLREAVRNGIAKINIGTDIRQAYERALRESDGDVASGRKAVVERIRRLVSEDFRVEGSAAALE